MATAEPLEADIRCECGKLMARWKDSHFEIKCQRCKRHHALACPGHPPSTPTPASA